MTNEDFLQYEPMLIKIANKFKNNPYGIDIDDIKQIGCLGMIRAFETYREDTGMKFDTYMYNCIKWSINKEIYNNKKKHEGYTVISMDHEVDEDNNSMYDIVPDENINVEAGVLEGMTLQEYIQEFKNILSPIKANIFIDRYVNELQIKKIASKYNKKNSAINSILRQCRSELLIKSYRIRNEYDMYITEKEAKVNYYNNPANIVYKHNRLKEIHKGLEMIKQAQI